ncbi:hypothetical protein [Tropicimonas marinistellae]|uniref:hypothetical protein n=1 Tax=Tropicimonas marinistellae TaxID=1739787 RepID=UPI0008352C0C|nr:hypothetical protein [Tropicimonas marinistellae]
MTSLQKVLAIAFVIPAGIASAEMMTTVECEMAKVTIDEKQTMMIKENTGEENFGRDVCEVVNSIDTAGLTDPTDVEITMSNGNVYNVTLQAME